MGSEEAGKQLIWFDRSGKELERVGSNDIANLWMWSLSPDGRRVALRRTIKGDFDVWLLEARRGLLTRFTGSSGSTIEPGAAIPLFWTHMYGAAQSNTALFPQYSVSPDGQRFLMNTITQVNAGPITVVLNGRFQERSAR